jgi:uncharacterized membrane protein YvlD (DUF360 family)
MQKHFQYLLSQPNENNTLKQIILLLVLPLFICLVLGNFDFILEYYALSFAAVTYLAVTYMKGIDRCKKEFDKQS